MSVPEPTYSPVWNPNAKSGDPIEYAYIREVCPIVIDRDGPEWIPCVEIFHLSKCNSQMPKITHTVPNLYDVGPLLSVRISISGQDEKALLANGKTLPNPVDIMVMVDTGATVSMFKPKVFKALGVNSFGSTRITTAKTIEQSGIHNISILFMSHDEQQNFGFQNFHAREMSFDHITEFDGVIGRDILKFCTFTYNGKTNTYTLDFD
jgi:hypothetical protein